MEWTDHETGEFLALLTSLWPQAGMAGKAPYCLWVTKQLALGEIDPGIACEALSEARKARGSNRSLPELVEIEDVIKRLASKGHHRASTRETLIMRLEAIVREEGPGTPARWSSHKGI